MKRNRGRKILLGLGVTAVVAFLLVVSFFLALMGPHGGDEVTCTPGVVQQERSNKAAALGTGANATDYFNQFPPADQKEMQANALLIVNIGLARGFSPHDIKTAIATAMQESNLHNLNYGDAYSHGLFQQQWTMGWGTLAQTLDPVHATNAFYDAMAKVQNRENMQMIDLAMKIQKPSYVAYVSRWSWDGIAAELFGDAGNLQQGPSPSDIPAALPVCTKKPSVVVAQSATVSNLSNLGSHILGDDYPYASYIPDTPSPVHYLARECVDFVSWRLNEQIGVTRAPFSFAGYGNAVTWKDRLVAQGYVADNRPAIGAVAWFDAWGGNPSIIQAKDLGHVAIVSAIYDDGKVLLEQYNGWQAPYQYGAVRVPAQMPGVMYIHVADIPQIQPAMAISHG